MRLSPFEIIRTNSRIVRKEMPQGALGAYPASPHLIEELAAKFMSQYLDLNLTGNLPYRTSKTPLKGLMKMSKP